MKIYFELDNIIADFDTKVLKITQTMPRDMKPHDMWMKLSHIKRFYGSLSPLPKAIRSFMELRKRALFPVEILTCLPHPIGELKTAKQDKEFWVRRYLFGSVPVNVVINRKYKPQFITDKDILVDNNAFVPGIWKVAGGIGFEHKSWQNTLDKLVSLNAIMPETTTPT